MKKLPPGEYNQALTAKQRCEKEELKIQEEITSQRKPLPDFIPNTWGLTLPIDHHRKVKKRNYWIYSKRPGVSKTRLLERMALLYSIYIQKGDKATYVFWDDYQSQEMIVLDEYNERMFSFATLNAFGDTKLKLKTFGGKKNACFKILVVLSNRSELYPNAAESMFLEERFQQIDVDPYKWPKDYEKTHLITDDIDVICDEVIKSGNIDALKRPPEEVLIKQYEVLMNAQSPQKVQSDLSQ